MKSIIGIDIGTSSVKVAVFKQAGSGLKFHQKGIQVLPVDMKRDQIKHCVQKAVGDLLTGVNLSQSVAYVNMNSESTYLKSITTPPMPEDELAGAIPLEAKNHFSEYSEDTAVAYRCLSETSENGVTKLRVALAASSKKEVERLVQWLKEMGLHAEAVVPVQEAMRNFMVLTSPQKEGVRCAVDIGEKFTDLVITDNGNPVFCRKIPVAAGDLTRSLMGVLASSEGRTGLTLKESETVKHSVGIPRAGQTDTLFGKITTVQIRSMLTEPLEQLSNEIGRCLDFYEEQANGARVSQVLLCGGGAELKGLVEYLSKELGVPVQKPDYTVLMNAKKNMSLELDDKLFGGEGENDLARYEIAFGLGLSHAGSLNFIFKEKKKLPHDRWIPVIATVLTVGLVLIGCFNLLRLYIGLNTIQASMDREEAELRALMPHLIQNSNDKVTYPLLAREPYWEEVFKELSNLMPANAHLTQLRLAGGYLYFEGVLDTRKEKGNSVSEFIHQLDSGIFANVQLIKSVDSGETGRKRFEVRCWVDAS